MTSAQEHMRPASRESQREGLRDLGSLAAAFVLAGLLLYILFQGKLTRFEDMGLGKNTSSVFATFAGDPIHCADMTDLAPCLRGFRHRGSTRAVLWLGNSQLHGVNQWKEGDETAPARLFSHLHERGLDLITLSQPNANLQEHLVLYAYARTHLPLRYLLLPAVFDDVRETGVRSMVAPALDDPATRAVLEASGAGRTIVAGNKVVANPDLAALDQTLQERTETFLNGWLERHVELWDLRPEARGRISNWLFEARNFVFGITPNSKRRLIEGRYLQNLAAAEAILADAQQQGIHVIVYLAPLRGDVAPPYVEAEYERFQREVDELAGRYGAEYLDLTSIVPGDLFGLTESNRIGVAADVDFMHFQAAGHALLAERLAAALDRAEGAGAP